MYRCTALFDTRRRLRTRKMINFILILCSFLATLYFYLTRTFKHWESKGVKYEKPIPVFGTVAATAVAKKNMAIYAEELYWKYPEEKVVGFFRFSNPELVVRDPEIIKRILSTDFNQFYSRSLLETDPDHRNLEPLRKNLFVVEGDLWRVLRQNTTHAFTSGKVKAMFPLILERTVRLQERVKSAAQKGLSIDARDLMARYTMDFIAACGLGIDVDSQAEEDSTFRKLALVIFRVSLKQVIVDVVKKMFPVLFKKVKHLGRVEKDFCNLVNDIIRQKNYKPSDRHDYIDLLLETREKGTMECESMLQTKPDGTPARFSMELDDELLAAQVFLFFGAGYETASSATSYLLHEIAYNPKEQHKIQADIDRVLKKHDNKLSYEAIKEMHYLDWAFKEGMRVLPPVGYLSRMCRKKCKIEELGFTVDEGTRVLIPASALHQDPKYWDSPEEFRPERFGPHINEPRHKYVYLPFGGGPRSCIGERLGHLQSLAGLAAILSHFSVSPAPTSVRRPTVDPRSHLVQAIKGGLPLIFTPRTSF